MSKIIFHHPKIQKTEDGSDTLMHSEQQELYHSRFGAYTEGQHIFINHGISRLNLPDQHPIRVLELGLGSGLNALLTWVYAEQNNQSIQYSSVEKYPVHPDIITSIHFDTTANQLAQHRDKLLQIHNCDWNQWQKLSPLFHLQKIYGDFENHLSDQNYHIIYYDAFAPEAQPDLWDEAAMAHCYDLLADDGIWVSYCAKGYVKRNLRKAGFEVTALPGPPRKREITLAIKKG